MKIIFFSLMLLFYEPASAQKDFEKTFPSFALSTLDHKDFSLDEIKKNTVSVFVFLLPDCPACQSYSLTLNEFSEKYKKDDVSFYGVFPGDYNSAEEMKEYQNRYHIKFLLLTDPGKKLVKNLGAKIAPEVFVVNNLWQTLYHGRIDDWMYAVGRKRKVISTHELQDALESVVHHQPVSVPVTNAVGCIIE